MILKVSYCVSKPQCFKFNFSEGIFPIKSNFFSSFPIASHLSKIQVLYVVTKFVDNTAICVWLFVFFRLFSLTSIFTSSEIIFPIEDKQELHHQKRLLALLEQLKTNYCTLGILLRLEQWLKLRHPGSSKL